MTFYLECHMYRMHGAELNMPFNHIIFGKVIPSDYLLNITTIAIISLCSGNNSIH